MAAEAEVPQPAGVAAEEEAEVAVAEVAVAEAVVAVAEVVEAELAEVVEAVAATSSPVEERSEPAQSAWSG